MKIGRLDSDPYFRINRQAPLNGIPMKFCSFLCDQADNKKAQHAACLAFNGVFCGILQQVIEKGTPCPVEVQPKIPAGPRRKKGKTQP